MRTRAGRADVEDSPSPFCAPVVRNEKRSCANASRRAAARYCRITSSFTWERRASILAELAPYRENALEGHPWGEWAEWAAFGSADASGTRMPGATSRWNRGKDLSWEPLRAELVCEVAFDHLQGDRFRHASTFRRWRPDKRPADCTYAQLEETPAFELARIFGDRVGA